MLDVARCALVAAVMQRFGMDAANDLNAQAVRETGKVEARRTLRLMGVDPPSGLRECLSAQEAMAQLLAPGLVDYELFTEDERTARFDVRRCFAYENVTRAGVAGSYRCGIFPRLQGWWEAFGVTYTMTPEPGECMLAAGRPCSYTIQLSADDPGSTRRPTAPSSRH